MLCASCAAGCSAAVYRPPKDPPPDPPPEPPNPPPENDPPLPDDEGRAAAMVDLSSEKLDDICEPMSPTVAEKAEGSMDAAVPAIPPAMAARWKAQGR